MATGKVGGDGASFTGDQLACSQIPGLEAQLPVTIDAASGHIDQIQAGGTGAADIGALIENAVEHLLVGIQVVTMAMGERGGQNATIQIAGLANADTVTVQLGTAATAGGKEFIADGIVDDAHFCPTLDAQGDGDSNMGNAFNKVGGAIQWVNDPLILRIFFALNTKLFADDTVIGISLEQGLDDSLFGLSVYVGHQVVFGLFCGLNIQGITKILGNNLTSITSRTNGNVEHWMHRLTHGC